MKENDVEVWILNNKEYFFKNKNHIHNNSDIYSKSFIELIYFLNMFPNSNLSKNKELSEHIFNNLNVSSVISYAIYNTTFANSPIIAYKWLRRHSYNTGNLLSKIKYLTEKKVFSYSTDTPFRKLDNIYELYTLGLVSKEEFILTSKDTILFKNENLLYTSEESAYALTHAIFYASDMGRKMLIKLPNSIKDRLLSLLAYYYIDEHIDLVCELLMCLKFIDVKLNHNEKVFIKKLYTNLKSYKFSNGAVSPGKLLDINGFSEEEVFKRCYHVSLVYLAVRYLYEEF